MLRIKYLQPLGLTVIALGITVGISGTAFAHVSKSDAGTAVLLHIIPDDLPQAGVETSISFSLSSINNNVSLPDCNCRVALIKDGKTLSTQLLNGAFIGAGNEGILKETFPDIGVYQLSVQGMSKTDRFNPFSITFPVRVASSNLPIKRTSGIVVAGCLVCSAALIFFIALICTKILRTNLIRKKS